MAVNHASLRAEIDSDPNAHGYAAHVATGNDAQLASLLNEPRAGAAFEFWRSDILPSEINAAITWSELKARTQPERDMYGAIIGAEKIDATKATIRQAFADIFPAGSASRDALTALAKRQGSRAEKLFGAGTVVSPTDVARAFGRV